MKLFIAIAFSLSSFHVLGQTNIDKYFPLSGSMHAELVFTHPKIIKVVSGNGQSIRIFGKASINQGENDEAFEFISTNDSGILKIESVIQDYENIPKRISISRNGEQTYFKTSSMEDPMVQKYLNENGEGYDYMNHGVIKNIQLTIEVPANVNLTIKAKYGLIDLEAYSGVTSVNSTYGGIDITVSESDNIEYDIRTRYGDIYTDLSKEIMPQPGLIQSSDKWTVVRARMGTGKSSCKVESKYGNIYVRKNK